MKLDTLCGWDDAKDYQKIYRIYDKIDEMEDMITAAKAKKRDILADKITSDNIYKPLVHFDIPCFG